MSKQTTKHHKLTEHYLVPAALFALNIGLVHVIYVYAIGAWDSYWHLAVLTCSPLALGFALLFKQRSLLIWSTVAYLVVFLCWP